MYPLYLAYALFCEGHLSKCLEELSKLLESKEPLL